ncbi:MAG: ROK family protein [Ilumatobacteraceae bacterium]
MTVSHSGYVALDIGGTKLAAAMVTVDGSVVISDRVPTPTRDPWSAVAALVSRVIAATPDVEPLALGAGCGGPMERGGETVSPLHIPAWRGFPLRSSLRELVDLPVAVDNDAKALALGEGWLGEAKGLGNYMAVVIGTGVGAGLVVGGHLIDGGSGNAGHLGHVIVEEGGLACRCGAHGCLEAYLSGSAIETRTGQSARQSSSATIVDAGRRFGRAVASVAALTSIERVVVAGSVALGWGDEFFMSARDEFGARSRLSFTQSIDIVPAGPRAGLIGAAALARRLVGGD